MKHENHIALKDGRNIPQLGLGTWQLRGKECEAAVLAALKAGYRHIDTASIYGNEEDVGAAIKRSGLPREEIFVTSKIWNTQHADPHAAIESTLERLRLDHVDLYLIHWPVQERKESWKALQKLKKDGLAASVGVSNFTIRHLEELPDPVPAVNQVEFNPFLYQKELLEYCKKHGIVLEAYSPLSHGVALRDERLNEIARKYGRSPAQTMLRWAIQRGVVVIPKSGNPGRIKENANVFDFEINESDMVSLDRLNKNMRTCWDPTDFP